MPPPPLISGPHQIAQYKYNAYEGLTVAYAQSQLLLLRVVWYTNWAQTEGVAMRFELHETLISDPIMSCYLTNVRNASLYQTPKMWNHVWRPHTALNWDRWAPQLAATAWQVVIPGACLYCHSLPPDHLWELKQVLLTTGLSPIPYQQPPSRCLQSSRNKFPHYVAHLSSPVCECGLMHQFPQWHSIYTYTFHRVRSSRYSCPTSLYWCSTMANRWWQPATSMMQSNQYLDFAIPMHA